MIDKEQKIREEVKIVVNRRLNLLNGDYFDLNKEADGFTNEIMDIIYSMQEEPASEDLEEAALLHLQKHYDTSVIWDEDEKCVVRDFKAGAKWQEQKDKSKVLTEEQCRKLSDDAFELGKDAMKQQLMAKAVDAVVKIDAGGYPYVDRTIELYDYDKDIPLAKRGDKVKIIVKL